MFKGKQLWLALQCLDTEEILTFQCANGVEVETQDQRIVALALFLERTALGLRDGLTAAKQRESDRAKAIETLIAEKKRADARLLAEEMKVRQTQLDREIKNLTLQKSEVADQIDSTIKKIVASIPEDQKTRREKMVQ